MVRVAVIGGGAFGTALAAASRRSGADVSVWALEPEVVADINGNHRNEIYLAGVRLDPGITATNELAAAVDGADLVLLVPPAQHLRGMSKQLAGLIDPRTHVLLCSKGLEQGTGALMTAVTDETMPGHTVGVLSGPTFAAELARNKPSAVTIASSDANQALKLCALLRSPSFRPYSTDDIIGAQIGGAVKNVLAIMTGMAAGLRMGENMRAAIITRGLAEMVRLGRAMGARTETLMGLSGLGDLVLTCSSEKSRNMSLGLELAKGRAVSEILGERRSVAEGYHTAPALRQLAERHGVEMAITGAVYRVLYEDFPARTAIAGFNERPVQPEWD